MLDRLLTWLDGEGRLFGHLLASLVGMGLLLGAGWGIFHALRQLLYWPKARAEIVRYTITRDEGGQRFYHPVLRFCTEEGIAVTTISSWGAWRRPWAAGTCVVIRYNPANPQWAEISCFANLWCLPLAFGGLAVAVGLLWWWNVL